MLGDLWYSGLIILSRPWKPCLNTKFKITGDFKGIPVCLGQKFKTELWLDLTAGQLPKCTQKWFSDHRKRLFSPLDETPLSWKGENKRGDLRLRSMWRDSVLRNYLRCLPLYSPTWQSFIRISLMSNWQMEVTQHINYRGDRNCYAYDFVKNNQFFSLLDNIHLVLQLYNQAQKTFSLHVFLLITYS